MAKETREDITFMIMSITGINFDFFHYILSTGDRNDCSGQLQVVLVIIEHGGSIIVRK